MITFTQQQIHQRHLTFMQQGANPRATNTFSVMRTIGSYVQLHMRITAAKCLEGMNITLAPIAKAKILAHVDRVQIGEYTS